MELKIFFGNDVCCAGGRCPTVYTTDNGNFVVQGYNVERKFVDGLPPGESLVELPREFIESFIKAYNEKQSNG